MLESFTAGALRALERASARARARGAGAAEPVDLLAALLDEPESRAAAILAAEGLDAARLFEALGAPAEPPDAGDELRLPFSTDLRALLGDASVAARSAGRGREVGTEHLLAGLLATPGAAADVLDAAGLQATALARRLEETTRVETAPLPLPVEIAAPILTEPGEAFDLARILDASANRAREGLRVVEDSVRFRLNDPGLTRRLKDVRHRLAAALGGFDPVELLASRDTPGDVGTHIMTASEAHRGDARAVLVANFKRTAEALRSLEEYSKLLDPWLAGRFEVLRYDVYTLEKLVLTAFAARQALGDARLYLLVGGLPTLGDLTWLVGEALAGGVQVVQLREKGLPDREVLHRAREVRLQTAAAGARFVLNDRPDLARLSGADGVHLGQEDLTVRDARRVVGPNVQVGVSTHDGPQLDRAVLDGASYLGVGPVFPSGTKEFETLAGLAFVRRAAESTNLPWFAIGGITEENLDTVLEAGATRVAVSSAILRADRPRAAAAALRARLDALG